jgi:membrane protein YfhO
MPSPPGPGQERPPPAVAASRSASGWKEAARALAGPALIAGAVVVVLHEVLFGGRIILGDISTFFLPNYCFLGKSLAAGHVPAWNPYTLGGVPFAADPQSGWMYFLPMFLFSALPCDPAMRLMIVALPILAGLGLYWFLRIEGGSRPAATVGGLALAVGMAGAELVMSLPFAGTLAWTSLALAASARYVRAGTWAGRFGWAGVVAILWGQVAASHFSIGLLMGTAALVAYLVTVAVRNVRAGAWTRGQAVGLGLLLVPWAALLNAAFILPRLAYLPETNLSLGYGHLQELGRQLAGFPVLPRQIGAAAAPDWPLDLAASPSAHLGAVTLGLSFAAMWSRERRHLAWAFSVLGALSYVLSQRAVAAWVLSVAPSWRVVDFYLRRPDWMGYGLLLALAALGALGLDAWLQAGTARRRALMTAPGVAVWGVLPLGLGAGVRLTLLGIGAAATAAALGGALRRPALAAAIPAVLAAELVANGFMGYRPLPFTPAPVLLVELPTPILRMGSYLRPDRIALALHRLPAGRYIVQDLPEWRRLKADPRSTVFGIEHAQGYNPVELKRYWFFVRAVTPVVLDHNLSIFYHPPAVLLDLLQVRYVVAPAWPYPTPFRGPLAAQGPARLFEAADAPPRASLVGGWTVVRGFDPALREVTREGFDPRGRVVLEADPGLGRAPEEAPAEGAGRAEYRTLGTQSARVAIEATAPSLVLIRTPYARGWHATVDGRDEKVLAADFFVQAVPVRPGRHTILLSYDDPSIGYGVAASAFGLALLIASILVAGRMDGRRGSGTSGGEVLAGRSPPQGPAQAERSM